MILNCLSNEIIHCLITYLSILFVQLPPLLNSRAWRCVVIARPSFSLNSCSVTSSFSCGFMSRSTTCFFLPGLSAFIFQFWLQINRGTRWVRTCFSRVRWLWWWTPWRDFWGGRIIWIFRDRELWYCFLNRRK